MIDSGVWELTERGSRLLHPAGSPEAAAWRAANAEPHDLTPLEPEVPVGLPTDPIEDVPTEPPPTPADPVDDTEEPA